jgi:hypothetical protein
VITNSIGIEDLKTIVNLFSLLVRKALPGIHDVNSSVESFPPKMLVSFSLLLI